MVAASYAESVACQLVRDLHHVHSGHNKIYMKANTIENPSTDWGNGNAKTITFLVTEDCQLRCRYCYIVGKNSFNRLSFETAKSVIEYILTNRLQFNDNAVIWDFIGGEPLLEIKLIDKICDYIKLRMYELNHPWFNNYRFNFSTNGILYHDDSVQKYIKKNKNHISMGITLDGIKDKHDKQRVYLNGKGSYDDVFKNIPLWLSQFPDASTKSTISHDDIPYIKESVLHLWNIGIKYVNINVVFEDVWQENDDYEFEKQLIDLANVIIDNDLYTNYYCSFFQRDIGKPLDVILQNQNWCGAGKMLAIDYKGRFFPCIRFADYSLSNKKSRSIGNSIDGINNNYLRPFLTIDRISQSKRECIECDVASGCAWCQGGNYDFAETSTIFQRATYICKLHKARVRANNYFWNRLDYKIKLNGKN